MLANHREGMKYTVDVRFGPTAGTVTEASAPVPGTPSAAANASRLGPMLRDALSGRTLQPTVARPANGQWSFEAQSRPQTGRPICLRRRLDRPQRSQFDPTDNVATWGFNLHFSTWSAGAPAYDNVWTHPSGACIHLTCRPEPDYTPGRKNRVYELHVDGVYDTPDRAPAFAHRPDAAVLEAAVLAALSNHVRFGATK